MSGELARVARGEGAVPLAWAGATSGQNHLNLGDALSPVMVALLSGKPARRVPFRSDAPRLVAVGTVAQNVAGGEAWFWGTGCSPHARGARGGPRFSPDPALRAHVAAARGPLSATLIGGGRLATRRFGDPVQLLPRFHPAPPAKRWELGVILHLSELADRSGLARPRPELARYVLPAEAEGRVRLIDTVTPVSAAGLRARLDEILACRRIVSTSLHGLVFAESYGIPCLPLVGAGPAGLDEVALTEDAAFDARMLDLYMGYGRTRTPVWRQPRGTPTDWEALIAAIDRAWTPARIDEDALIEAFPLDLAPLAPRPGETVWEHPAIAGLDFAHEVAALRRADAEAGRAARAARAEAEAEWAARLRGWRLPATVARPAPPRLRLRREGEAPAFAPLCWAAGPEGAARVNLGDALSPVIVAAMTGLPVRHRAFDSRDERLAAVGTIAHGLRNGRAHVWGAGLDEAVSPGRPGEPWSAPPDTELHVHAARGPMTAAAFRRQGIPAPETFGDPVYLLDRIFPLGELEITHELGVIVHLSELAPEPGAPEPGAPESGAEAAPRLRPELARYRIPPAFADRVRILDTTVAPSLEAFRRRLAEIAACRAILSTSLHGLVIAETYGRPSAWFGFRETGLREVDPMDRGAPLDHRMRDLYAGQGLDRVAVIDARRDRPAEWDRLIGLAGELAPRRPDVRALFEAFPGPLAAAWEDPVWPLPRGLVPGLA